MTIGTNIERGQGKPGGNTDERKIRGGLVHLFTKVVHRGEARVFLTVGESSTGKLMFLENSVHVGGKKGKGAMAM